MNPQRRKILSSFVKGGALAAAAPFLIRNALAMGDRIHTQGIHKLESTVLVEILGSVSTYRRGVVIGNESVGLGV